MAANFNVRLIICPMLSRLFFGLVPNGHPNGSGVCAVYSPAGPRARQHGNASLLGVAVQPEPMFDLDACFPTRYIREHVTRRELHDRSCWANCPAKPQALSQTMRILVADDDVVTCRILERILQQWGYEVEVTRDGPDALERLRAAEPPRIALLDWVMPTMSGVEVCRILRAERQEPYIYTILLTAKSSVENVIKGLEAGADDYLIKPVDPYALRARLRPGRRIIQLHDELVEAREALRYQADHDPLTGLWNRGGILAILRKEFSRATRDGSSVAVCMVDIDHFKKINDKHGHVLGDQVLKEVTSRMSDAVRLYDEVGRYGGEEFIVILPNNTIGTACLVAERIRECIDAAPVETDQGPVPVQISVGVATSDLAAFKCIDDFVHAADAALYEAKRTGRNRVVAAIVQESKLP